MPHTRLKQLRSITKRALVHVHTHTRSHVQTNEYAWARCIQSNTLYIYIYMYYVHMNKNNDRPNELNKLRKQENSVDRKEHNEKIELYVGNNTVHIHIIFI